MLLAECNTRQGKESKTEIKEVGDLFLKYSNLENSKNVKGALLCASKCFFEFRRI